MSASKDARVGVTINKHKMLRVRVCATHMVGFWVQNFGVSRFSLNMSGFCRTRKMLTKMGSLLPNLIIKVAMTATVGN